MNGPLPIHVLTDVLFHSQDTRPEQELVALVVAPPEAPDDDPEVLGLYAWNGEDWLDEEHEQPIPHETYWWVEEAALVRALKNPALYAWGDRA